MADVGTGGESHGTARESAQSPGDVRAMDVIVELLREMQDWRRESMLERKEAARERRWRMVFQAVFFGVPVLLSVLYFLFFLGASGFSFGPLGETVALVKISGEINATGLASANKVVPALREAFENPKVRGVVLAIDSPGGAPAEAERIYKALAHFRQQHNKPVVAVIGNTGASAGYMIAMHADSVHAASYSLVGSIGAVMMGWDFHKALDRLNVAQRVYASGELKAMLNPFTPNTAQADEKARALVSGLGGAFVEELKRIRGSRLKSGVNFATGEVWGGYEAKELGLVDSVATLEEVVAARWPGLPLHDFGPRPSNGIGSVFGQTALPVDTLLDQLGSVLYARLR
jgi:protease-4